MVSILLANGAAMETRDIDGNRPLDLARFGTSPRHYQIRHILEDAMDEARCDCKVWFEHT